MTTNFTLEQHDDVLFVVAGNNETPNAIARMVHGTEQQAALLSAAPELLDILERILGAHDTKNNGAYIGEASLCRHYAETARAAIAKAKGK